MVNSKKKGNLWENKLANWLRDNGIKAWKDGASGGGSREKGDIGNNINMTIESKAAKNIILMDWWKQVKKSAELHQNSPVLFIHQDGMGEEDWLVVMSNHDWLESIKTPKVETGETTDDRSMKWALQGLKTAIQKVLKYLPN